MRRCVLALVVAGLCAALLQGCATDEERRQEHVQRAEEYLQDGQAREALLELRSALRLAPRDAELNFRIAEIAKQLGQVADAAFFYGEAFRLDPTRTDAGLAQAGLLVFDDREKARELVAAALDREPDSPEAYLVLSRIELVEPRLDEAMKAARTAIELAPEDPAAYDQLGKIYHARVRFVRNKKGESDAKDYEAGLEAFRRASELSDDEHRWHGVRGRAKLLADWEGHQDDAEAAFRELLRTVDAHNERGVVLDNARQVVTFAREARRIELAREALEVIIAREPGNLVAWSNLARLAVDLPGGEDAVYRRMLEQRADDPEAHFLYARYLAEGEGRGIEAANAYLEEQIEAGVEPARLLSEQVNLLYAYGRDDEAEAAFTRLSTTYPDDPSTTLASAQHALRRNDASGAVAILRRLEETSPSIGAYQLLAAAERRLGNTSKALDAVDRAMELAEGGAFPDHLVRLRAHLQAESGDWLSVLRTFSLLTRQGESLTPEERLLQARALYNSGRRVLGRRVLENVLAGPLYPVEAALLYVQYEKEDRPEEVLALLTSALELRPRDPRLLTARARLELEKQRPEEALAILDRAAEARRVTPMLSLERARALAALGQLDAAQQEALRAFDANPKLTGAARLLVGLYRAQGKDDEAIASFEQALEAGVLAPPAQYLLAQLHAGAGHAERARELLEALLAQGQTFPAAQNDLAYLLAESGEDLERAVTLAQAARSGLPHEAAVAHTLGYVYLKRGLNGPAVDQFRAALQMDDAEDVQNRPLYYFHLGQALEALGRAEEASQAYEQAVALDADFGDARRAREALQKSGAESS